MATESLSRFQRIDRCDELLVESAAIADMIQSSSHSSEPAPSEAVAMSCVMLKQKLAEIDEHLSALK